MPKVAALVKKIARANSILVLGESGVGKELVAGALRECGERPNENFVTLDCANLRGDTIKSELFGHEAGAFTDAKNRRIGAFERANRGTLFLDEIGEIPFEDQSRLLRVLQEQKFVRLGGSTEIKTDFCFVAATNKNLARMVKEKTFREDLYFRINRFPIVIPPLRSRMGDVIRLANHFVDKFAHGSGKKLGVEAERALMRHSWPGNVRELSNIIERGVLYSGDAEFISEEDLAIEAALDDIVLGANGGTATEQELGVVMEKLIRALKHIPTDKSLLHQIEKLAIKMVLEMNDSQLGVSSKILGIDQATLYRKRKEYGWDKEKEPPPPEN